MPARSLSRAEVAIARTARRFALADARRATFHYVLQKLRRDPCVSAIHDLGPLGDVVDLGCGRAQLDVFLLESGAARSVRGFDWDARKIAIGARAAEGLAASFERGDVRTAEAAPADTVLLVDVLHYFRPEEQDALLARAAGLVRDGGRLVVRTPTTAAGWRSTLTLLVERISTAIRFNRGEGVVFRDVAAELVPVLDAAQMTSSVVPCWRGTPFANVLLVASVRHD